MHKVAEVLYKSQAAGAAPGGAPGGAGAGAGGPKDDGDVVDVEYTEDKAATRPGERPQAQRPLRASCSASSRIACAAIAGSPTSTSSRRRTRSWCVAEIAGVRSDDLRVTVDGEELRISGVRRVPERADVQRLHQMEIAAGPFERRLRIPIPFDREKRHGAPRGRLSHRDACRARGPQRRQVKLET